MAFLPASYACAIALDRSQAVVKRLCCAGFTLLCLYVILFKAIGWVSGWLGLLVALLTVIFISSRKAFAIIAVILCVCTAIAWPWLDTKVVKHSKEEGDYDRFAMMSGALKYATSFPLGVGLGNYRTYNSFHYGEKWGTTTYTSAHGTYSQSLSETGLPGLILFMVTLSSGFLWIRRSYRKLPPGPSRTFLLAVMGQMAGIVAAAFIGDYIIPAYHNGGLVNFSGTVYSWIIWGVAIAHVRISGGEVDGSVDINR